MPRANNGYIEFSTAEAKAAHCPICGGEHLKRSAPESTPKGIIYPWRCDACGATGDEYATAAFAGHRVSYVPDKYIIPGISGAKGVKLRDSLYQTLLENGVPESHFTNHLRIRRTEKTTKILRAWYESQGEYILPEAIKPTEPGQGWAYSIPVAPEATAATDYPRGCVPENGRSAEEAGIVFCGVCHAELLCDDGGDMPDICPKCGEKIDWTGWREDDDEI